MTSTTAVITDDDRRMIVIGALLSMFLAALDQTIVSPALPTIGAALDHAEWLPWVISAYFLTATAVTPLYGKLADIRGRRPVLIAAVGLFLLGSVLCALAPSMLFLVLGRAVQGLGGGGLIALAQTIIGDVVAPRDRGRYMGLISGTWALASLAGPVIGGLFAEHIHWSLIFWINLPLAALALYFSERTLRKLPNIRHQHRLDIVGAVVVILATMALMLAMTWGGATYPWASPTILSLLAASVLLFAYFAIHLTRAPEPLIPPRVLVNRNIFIGTSSMFFGSMSMVGLAVFIPVYLQLVFGFGPANAGFALVALLGGTVVGAYTSGRAMSAQRGKYKAMALAGSLLAIFGMLLLAYLVTRASFPFVAFGIFITGIGQGSQYPVTTVAVQNGAEPRDLGVATAALAFVRSLGSVAGVTGFGAILIGTGVIASAGEAGHQIAATASPDHAAYVFQWVMLVAALCQALSFFLMTQLKEVPLRTAPAAVAMD